MFEPIASPIPPRFLWLKRLTALYLLLAGTLTGVWFGWNAFAEDRIAARIADIHARGEPVLAADFENAPLPDDQNAALLILQAAAFSLTKAQEQLDAKYDWLSDLSPADRVVLKTFPVQFATNLATARQARTIKHADFGWRLGSPMVNTTLPWLGKYRELANLQANSFLAQHLDGNDAESIELLQDILHGSNMVDDRAFFPVEYFVAAGVESIVTDRLFEYFSDLAIERPQPSTTLPTQPASRAQVKSLITSLLDESYVQNAFERAECGERAVMIDLAHDPISSLAMFGRNVTANQSPLGINICDIPPFNPVYKLKTLGITLDHDKRIAAAKLSGFSAVKAAWPAPVMPTATSPWLSPSTLADSGFRWSTSYVPNQHYRVLTNRRAAATLLAIRLYQLDHADRVPEKLSDLVPAYLPAVPIDPFAADGRPMGYLPSINIDGVETAVVYSVDEDGADDHASTKPARNQTKHFGTLREQRNSREDLVFPLKPAPLPPPKPSDDTQ